MTEPSEPTPHVAPTSFIRQIIDADLASGKHQRIVTRFPPEPNGYLHIGHAKSICLNFGLARDYGGVCHLRFDDTNPLKEDQEYVDAIQRDVRWLGFEWNDKLFHASDYFPKLYEYAVKLVRDGKAYVCDLTEEEFRAHRGTVTTPGTSSPHRSRSVEENLTRLEKMRKGEFADGACVLRAKGDMASPNMKMRDPILYRIRHTTHHRTHDDWCIYPIYDFAHCFSDSIEGITHSLCTLEFENNRELYDWYLNQAGVYRPQQIEFARLNLTHTVMSKRKLLELVTQKLVSGWDDPRMPTLAGMRRRGYTPEAIRAFCDGIGVARADNLVDFALLEHHVRDDLNPKVPRRMAVMRPLKLVVESWPEGKVEEIEAPDFPDDPPRMGTRALRFARELFIERDDFMEHPPKKFFRLAPGQEVRLRWSYIVRCTRVVKDAAGEVVEVHCTHDPESRGGNPTDGRKIKGTIHWVPADGAIEAEVRLYDHLFAVSDPSEIEASGDWAATLNPKSLEAVKARVEPSLGASAPGQRYQFERQGYFIHDTDNGMVFNRIVALKDSWAKIAKKAE
ncbi:MAG: glutamine--tRNA ligase/YqeY domain fusion protein [Deltaproteobacteria bacterium]|nr:glutamine--tRNA ligase/YqeY domain fusion protein [Deltaproteobacteria bacterium]